MIAIINTNTEELTLFTTKTGAAETFNVSVKTVSRSIDEKKPFKKVFKAYFCEPISNKKLKRRANF